MRARANPCVRVFVYVCVCICICIKKNREIFLNQIHVKLLSDFIVLLLINARFPFRLFVLSEGGGECQVCSL